MNGMNLFILLLFVFLFSVVLGRFYDRSNGRYRESMDIVKSLTCDFGYGIIGVIIISILISIAESY